MSVLQKNSNGSGELDLERLRRTSDPAPHVSPSPCNQSPLPKRETGLFIKGPIPLNWIARAARLGGKTLHVALTLWFLKGLRRNRTVMLSNSKLKLFGVGRHSSYRALEGMEEAGLITVERQPGRNPMVTILEVEDKTEGNPRTA